jgi:NAD(P)-dependent dehydrogenase (short-subunit alcohol dehydrogenase family)
VERLELHGDFAFAHAENPPFGSRSAMRRAAQPEEIAPAFVFMAAPCCSSYITGEILPVIGGYRS